MSETPPMKRLVDDPQALQELGVRLDDPALAPKPLDLDALEARLVQGMAAADAALSISQAASGWSSLIIKGASVLSAMVLGGVLHATWMQFNPAPPPPPLIVTHPIPVALTAAAPAAPSTPAPRPTPVFTPRTPSPAPAGNNNPPAPVPAAVDVDLSLAEQLRLYESGRTALNAGNHQVALREFDRYVRVIPDGDLWPEAALGLMQALRGTEDWGRLDSWCTTLLEDSRLTTHKRRILQHRSRARAHLGACQSAEQDAFKGYADITERAAAMEEVRALCGTAY